MDSTTVLGEGDGKYYISVGAVNKSGHTVYGEAVQLQLSDTVAPDDVNSVIELQQSRNNTGNNPSNTTLLSSITFYMFL